MAPTGVDEPPLLLSSAPPVLPGPTRGSSVVVEVGELMLGSVEEESTVVLGTETMGDVDGSSESTNGLKLGGSC